MEAFQKSNLSKYVVMKFMCVKSDLLWGLVVRVAGYRFRCPGSIPGAARFSEKQWVWNGVHSTSRVQLLSFLEDIVAAPV
jgi:hypothetical protein